MISASHPFDYHYIDQTQLHPSNLWFSLLLLELFGATSALATAFRILLARNIAPSPAFGPCSPLTLTSQRNPSKQSVCSNSRSALLTVIVELSNRQNVPRISCHCHPPLSNVFPPICAHPNHRQHFTTPPYAIASQFRDRILPACT